MPAARIIEVIEVKSTRGDGTEKSPFRGVTEYFSKEGDLLAECDPLSDANLDTAVKRS